MGRPFLRQVRETVSSSIPSASNTRGVMPANLRLNAHELQRIEGLGNIVVRADVEPRDALRDRSEGAYDDDVRLHARIADLPDDFLPVHARKHQVDGGEIVGAVEEALKAFLPVGDRLAGIADGGQSPPHEGPFLRIILDDKRVHAPIIPI